MKILVVEDERRLSLNITKGITEQGFAVDQSFDGEEGLYMAQTGEYDLIILDIVLPKMDGIEICKTLRIGGNKTPILMLTAKATAEDAALGLDAGADDYLGKPFSFIELKSRIHALIRRSHNEGAPTKTIADLELDPLKHTVARGGRNISVTPKEFSVLEYLLAHKDEAVSRTMIMEHVWDYNFEGMSNVVDVFVASLRRKIDKDAPVKLIHTVFGLGYKISESP